MKRIQRGGDVAEATDREPEKRLQHRRANTTSSSTHIRESTGKRFTSLFRSTAHPGAHGAFEGGEVDFAFRDHVGDFGGCFAELVAEQLEYWNAAACQLHQVVALEFAAGCD